MDNMNCSAKELGSFPNRRKPHSFDGGTTLNSTSSTQFDYSVPDKGSSIKYNRATTMKEYEEQLEALRTENYNLRLRIYNMEEKINDEKNSTKKSHTPSKVSFDDQQCESDLNDSHSENDKDLNCLEFSLKENKCCNVNIRAFKTIQELLKVNKRIMKINCQLKKQLETKLASNKIQVDFRDNSSSFKCDETSPHNSTKQDTTGKMCTEISDLQTELNKKQFEITQLQSQLDSLKLLESEEILTLRSKLVLKDKEINELSQQVKKLHHNLQELVNTELWEKNKEISKLILKEAERKQLVDSANKNVVSSTPSSGEGRCKIIYNTSENNENESSQQLMSYSEVNRLIEKMGNLSTILQTNDDICTTNDYEQLRNHYAQVMEELEAMKWKQKETAKLCTNLSSHLDELSVFLDVVGTNFSESKSLKNEIHRMVKRNQQISKSLVELCFKGCSSGISNNVPVLPDYSEINFFSCDEMSPSEELAKSAERTTSIFGKHFGNDSIEKKEKCSDDERCDKTCEVAKEKIADELNGSDNWSEPDKHVSSARIGLANTFPVLHTESDSSVENPKETKQKRQRKSSNNNRVSIKITKEEYKKLKSALQFFTKYSRMLFENSAYERDMEKLVLVNSYLREINEKNMAKIQHLIVQINSMKSDIANSKASLNCGQDQDPSVTGDDVVERLKAENSLVCAQLQQSKEKLDRMERQLDGCRAAEKELVCFKETYCEELKAKLEAEVQNKFDIYCRNYEILCCLVEKTVKKITKMEEAVKELSANCDGVAVSQSTEAVVRLTGDLDARDLERRLNSVTEMLESARCENDEAAGHLSYLNDVITCKSKLIEAYQEQKKTLESKLAELETELRDTAVALNMRERENKELYLILLEYEKDKERIDAEAVTHAEQMDRIREDHRLEMLKLTNQICEYRKEEEGTFTLHMNVLDEIPKQIELLKLNKQKWQEMFEKSENDKNHFKSMLELILNLNQSKTQCFVDGQTANQKETTDHVF